MMPLGTGNGRYCTVPRQQCGLLYHGRDADRRRRELDDHRVYARGAKQTISPRDASLGTANASHLGCASSKIERSHWG